MDSSPDFLVWLYESAQLLPWWLTYPAISAGVFVFGPAAGVVFSLGVAFGELHFWPTLVAYAGGAIARDVSFCYLVHYGVNKNSSWLRRQWIARQLLAGALKRVRVHSWRNSWFSYYTLLVASRFIKPPYVPLGVIATGVILKKPVRVIVSIIVTMQLIFSSAVLILVMHPLARSYLTAGLSSLGTYAAVALVLYGIYWLDRSQHIGLRIWWLTVTISQKVS